MPTYSFLDTTATMAGPGVIANIGASAAVAEEGITIERDGEKTGLTIGADGTPMHSLHADNSGTVVVRLLKTSPTNAVLSAAFNAQSSSSSLWGINVITVANPVTGDDIVCTDVAFTKFPSVVYAKEGGMNEWSFKAGRILGVLG